MRPLTFMYLGFLVATTLFGNVYCMIANVGEYGQVDVDSGVEAKLSYALHAADTFSTTAPLLAAGIFDHVFGQWMPLHAVSSKFDAKWALLAAERQLNWSLSSQLSQHQSAVAIGQLDATSHIELLRRALRIYSIVKEPFKAIELGKRVLQMVAEDEDVHITIDDLVGLYAEMANAYISARQYKEGLQFLERTMEHAELNVDSMVTLGRLHSKLYTCNDEPMKALDTFESLTQLRSSSGLQPYANSSVEVLEHIYHLKRVVGDSTFRDAGKGVPENVRTQLRKRASQLIQHIITTGPWRDPTQLPLYFDEEGRHVPWIDVNAENSPYGDVAMEAAALAPALLREANKLRKRRLLTADTQCLHNKAGEWRYYDALGSWARRVPAACSIDSPVLCRFLADSSATHARYSFISKGTHIKPHFAADNANVRLQLALQVEPTQGSPCASVRVGEETRDISRHSVHIYDPSFEHELYTSCSGDIVLVELDVPRYKGE